MVTSTVPGVCTTRGMSFIPSNGVAARQRKSEVEAQIAEARREQEEAARKWTRTSKKGR